MPDAILQSTKKKQPYYIGKLPAIKQKSNHTIVVQYLVSKQHSSSQRGQSVIFCTKTQIIQEKNHIAAWTNTKGNWIHAAANILLKAHNCFGPVD